MVDDESSTRCISTTTTASSSVVVLRHGARSTGSVSQVQVMVEVAITDAGSVQFRASRRDSLTWSEVGRTNDTQINRLRHDLDQVDAPGASRQESIDRLQDRRRFRAASETTLRACSRRVPTWKQTTAIWNQVATLRLVDINQVPSTHRRSRLPCHGAGPSSMRAVADAPSDKAAAVASGKLMTKLAQRRRSRPLRPGFHNDPLGTPGENRTPRPLRARTSPKTLSIF